MTESIAKNTLTIFTAKLVTSFLLFLTGILIAREFGPSGVGTYDLFIAMINFSIMLGNLGIGIASVYLLNKRKEDAARLFFHVLLIGSIWGVILAVITFFVFSLFPFLPLGFPQRLIFLAALAIPFVLLQNYLLPFLLAKFRTYQWSFFSIFYAGLIAVGTFFVLKTLKRGVEEVAFVVPLSSCITFLFLFIAVFRLTSLRFGFKKNIVKQELSIGLTSYLGDIFQVANFKLNLFLVSMFLNIAQVGYYSVALNIANVFFIIPYAFQQVLYSSWSLLREKDVDENTPVLARQTFLVALGAAISIFLLGKYVVVNMFYGKEFSHSISPLAFLLPGAICMVFANIFFNNFYSRGKASLTTYILLVVFALNIVLNIFFIPSFGIQGAAIAASFSYFVAAILALFLFSRISGFSIKKILTFQSSDVTNLMTQFLKFSGLGSIGRMMFGLRSIVLQKKIKICHVASADITLRFLIFSQLQYLQQSGFDVYTVSSSGKWVKDITDAGIPHTTIRIVRKVFTPLEDFTALVQLFLLFKKEKFDIVHTHTLKASFLAHIAAFFAGVPVRVYTIHGLDFLNTSFPPIARKIFMFVDRIIASMVHLTFTVNKEAVEIVQEIGMYPRNKIAYLGVGIDLEKFNPARFSKDFILKKKKELGILPKAQVVGMVARLVGEKGFFELFEAWDKVVKEFPKAMLIIVGGEEPEKTDSFTPDIVKRYGIENNVIFLGERKDIDELNAVFDVLVLPSYREGLGITLLEASAMKKPVIASDISGCREAVDNGETGILVPSKNSEKVAEAILYLLKNPEKAKVMGEAGRRKVEWEFDEKVMFERVRVEYEYLLKAKLKN